VLHCRLILVSNQAFWVDSDRLVVFSEAACFQLFDLGRTNSIARRDRFGLFGRGGLSSRICWSG
jgi:hypothetical protein